MITAQSLITLFRQAPEEQWGRIRDTAGEPAVRQYEWNVHPDAGGEPSCAGRGTVPGTGGCAGCDWVKGNRRIMRSGKKNILPIFFSSLQELFTFSGMD